METIKITASKTQNQTELLPSKLNSPTLTLTTHTLATTTTATTQYERRGLKKKEEEEGRGTRDEGECEKNDNKLKHERFCRKALYYNVLSASRVSNTTLFIGPKMKLFL